MNVSSLSSARLTGSVSSPVLLYPTRTIVDPFFAICIACDVVICVPAVSITISVPRPPVSSLTFAITSSLAPLMTPVAPSSIAFSRRLSMISTTYTSDTPLAFNAISDTSPIHPAPITTAFCPRCASPWIAAWNPTARGSIKAPSNVLTLSGSLKQSPASCATYS